MFVKAFRMELKRAFSPAKWVAVTVAVAVLLVASVWEIVVGELLPQWGDTVFTKLSGALDCLQRAMLFDVFKVVAVILLAGLHTGSYCRDENTKYLRFLLSREDIYTYTRSRFCANLIAVLASAVTACLMFIAAFVAVGLPLVSEGAQGGRIYYVFFHGVAANAPLLYAVMLGIEYGLVAAMCSSVGMLFSAYQPNALVSMGVSGLVFFVLISSGLLNGTWFDIANLLPLECTIGSAETTPKILMAVWAVFYPLAAVAVCCRMFERRMEKRFGDGSM